MNQKVAALVGISGVGKTTFLKQVAKTCAFQHLTAGSLIAQASSIDVAARDRLRLSDVDENQRLLVQGFSAARDNMAQIVVLDGHVVIHSAAGMSLIDSRVFSDLGTGLIAHLEAAPAQIQSNRVLDTSRKRPLLSIDELSAHQARSLAEAQRVAEDLGIELIRLTHDDADVFGRFLSGSSLVTLKTDRYIRNLRPKLP